MHPGLRLTWAATRGPIGWPHLRSSARTRIKLENAEEPTSFFFDKFVLVISRSSGVQMKKAESGVTTQASNLLYFQEDDISAILYPVLLQNLGNLLSV